MKGTQTEMYRQVSGFFGELRRCPFFLLTNFPGSCQYFLSWVWIKWGYLAEDNGHISLGLKKFTTSGNTQKFHFLESNHIRENLGRWGGPPTTGEKSGSF